MDSGCDSLSLTLAKHLRLRRRSECLGSRTWSGAGSAGFSFEGCLAFSCLSMVRPSAFRVLGLGRHFWTVGNETAFQRVSDLSAELPLEMVLVHPYAVYSYGLPSLTARPPCLRFFSSSFCSRRARLTWSLGLAEVKLWWPRNLTIDLALGSACVTQFRALGPAVCLSSLQAESGKE